MVTGKRQAVKKSKKGARLPMFLASELPPPCLPAGASKGRRTVVPSVSGSEAPARLSVKVLPPQVLMLAVQAIKEALAAPCGCGAMAGDGCRGVDGKPLQPVQLHPWRGHEASETIWMRSETNTSGTAVLRVGGSTCARVDCRAGQIVEVAFEDAPGRVR